MDLEPVVAFIQGVRDFPITGDGSLTVGSLAMLIIVMVAAWIVGSWARRIARRSLASLDDDVRELLATAICWLVRVGGILVALNSLPSGVAPIYQVVAALTVGIGFALSDTGKNLIAGVYLRVEGRYSEGDRVVTGGVTGKIVGIGFRAIQIDVGGGDVASIPATAVLTSTVTKLAVDRAEAPLDFTVGVLPGSNLGTVRTVLRDAVLDASGSHVTPVTTIEHLGASWVVKVAWMEAAETGDAYKTDAMLRASNGLREATDVWLVRGPLQAAGVGNLPGS